MLKIDFTPAYLPPTTVSFGGLNKSPPPCRIWHRHGPRFANLKLEEFLKIQKRKIGDGERGSASHKIKAHILKPFRCTYPAINSSNPCATPAFFSRLLKNTVVPNSYGCCRPTHGVSDLVSVQCSNLIRVFCIVFSP